jgi:hypothetical protein
MTRSDLFVYIVLAAAWILLALWMYRIGKKADRVQALIEASGGAEESARAALPERGKTG